jgi:hypothetical protein
MCHSVIFAIARWVFLCFVSTEILDDFDANRYKLWKGRKSRNRVMKENNNMEHMKHKEKGKEDREQKNKVK